MTLHYPDTDPAPTPYGATARDDLGTVHVASTDVDETLVPIYARKPVRKSYNKKLLMAVPVVLALGVGAWALTMGESSRPAGEAALTDTDSLTTSRLDVAQPISPEVAVPAVTEAVPLEAAPVPAAAPTPAARIARPTTPAPAARRAAAPARRAPSAATAPAAPQPYNSPALTITEPAPVAAPPPMMAPTPVLPADPAPTETPPGG